jgi:hypothetical protein
MKNSDHILSTLDTTDIFDNSHDAFIISDSNKELFSSINPL